MENKFYDRKDSNYHLVSPILNTETKTLHLRVRGDLLTVLDWKENDLLCISKDDQGNYQFKKIYGTGISNGQD